MGMMRSKRMRLTERGVRALRTKRGEKYVQVCDTVTPNLLLRCTETGAKSYYYVYKGDARVSEQGVRKPRPTKWLRLGSPADLDVADARDEVRKYRAGRVH